MAPPSTGTVPSLGHRRGLVPDSDLSLPPRPRIPLYHASFLNASCVLVSLPVAPALVQVSPACTGPSAGFSSLISDPGLAPSQCPEPAMAPQCPQEKAQLVTVALRGLASARLNTHSFWELCSSYSASLVLSPPSTSLLPPAVFHCLFNKLPLLLQEALLDSQTS